MKIPTILIVDDEPDQLERVKKFLGNCVRCEFASASNGDDAVKYIKSLPCDIMILDIKMPKKGGMAVLDEAKDMPIYKIVYTGWDSDQVFEACKDRAVDEFISKGDSLNELCDKVTKALKKRKQFYQS